MDGQQPSKLYCVGSNPTRNVFVATRAWQQIMLDFIELPYYVLILVPVLESQLILLLRQEVMNGCKFQEELQGKLRINQ